MAKRRTPKSKSRSISRQAVEAFVAGDAQALYLALDLRPWEPCPLDVDGPEPPAWARNDGTAWSQAWPEIWGLRQRLEEASR